MFNNLYNIQESYNLHGNFLIFKRNPDDKFILRDLLILERSL